MPAKNGTGYARHLTKRVTRSMPHTKPSATTTANAACCRVDPLVRWYGLREPGPWMRGKDKAIECCWRVNVLLDGPGGDISNIEYVAGPMELSIETAIAVVAEHYAGDWGFSAERIVYT